MLRSPLRFAVLAAAGILVTASCSSDVEIPLGGGGAGGAGSGAGTTTGQGSGTAPSGSQSSGTQSTGSQSSGSQSSGSQTSGSQSSGSMSSGSGSTSSGQLVCASASPCQACVASACPEAWCECTESTACGALFACWQTCSDQACSQACLEQFPDAISNAILVSSCGAGPCEASCPGAGEPLSPCEECLYTSCDAEMNACLSTPDCTGLWSCFAACGSFDLTCQQDCYAAFPAGAQPLEDVFACAELGCPMICN